MTDSEKIEMLVDALTRIALIEIERGMYGPEAIERGMAAIGYAERALEKLHPDGDITQPLPDNVM